MICKNLKVFFILSVALSCLLSAPLSAEWCYSDEEKEALDNTFEALETERREQMRQLETQAMLYEVAEKSIEIFRQEISDIKALSKKAELSWQAERIDLILKAGGVGIVIGGAVYLLVDMLIDLVNGKIGGIFNP